ncbi:MAG: hypothetical protein KDA25_06380 [Phycisphaerales bacterium]|nr:hypothetical protein [Phycisphaerales bacterium]
MHDPHANRTDSTVEPAATDREPSNPPPATPSLADPDRVLDIISDVEAKLQRIRSAQTSQTEEFASLAQRQIAVEAAEASIAEARQAVQDQQESLHFEIDDFEKKRLHFVAAQEQFNERKALLRDEIAAIEQRRHELDDQSHAVERARAELDDARRALDEQRAADAAIVDQARHAVGEFDALTQRLDDAERRAESLATQLDESARNAAAQQDALDTLDRTCRELDAKLADARQQADAARRELDAQTAAHEAEIAEHRERLAAHEARLAEQAETLAAQTETLRERDETIEERDARLATLEESRAEHEQILDDARETIAAHERGLAQRDEEIARHKRNLEMAAQKLTELSAAVEAQSASLEQGVAAAATVLAQTHEMDRLREQLAAARAAGASSPDHAAKDAELASLREQLEGQESEAALAIRVLEQKIEAMQAEQATAAASAGSDGEAEVAMRSRIAELEGELATVRAALSEASSGTGGPGRAVQAELDSLRSQVAELTAALAHAREELRASQAGVGPNVIELRETARRIKTAAQQLQTRKARLRRVRELMRERQPAGGGEVDYELRSRQLRELQQQRQSLAEAQLGLAASEKSMIRRWARGRAVSTLFQIIIMAAVFAAGSWFAADRFFPAERSASVSVKAKTKSELSLSDEEIAAWQQLNRELVYSEPFQKTLAKRMADRQLVDFASPAAVGALVRDRLTVSEDGDDLVIVLAGTKPDTTIAVLDTIATTIAAEASRQATTHRARARTVVVGEREEGGRIRYASMDPSTSSDRRLEYAGMIFGGSFGACLLLVLIFYARLSKAKRVFDEVPVPVTIDDV